MEKIADQPFWYPPNQHTFRKFLPDPGINANYGHECVFVYLDVCLCVWVCVGVSVCAHAMRG